MCLFPICIFVHFPLAESIFGEMNETCIQRPFLRKIDASPMLLFFNSQVVREVKVEVEVPVDRVVVQEVPVYVDRMVEKQIEVPVDRIITKEVPVYIDQVVEKIVEHVKEVPVQASPQTPNLQPSNLLPRSRRCLPKSKSNHDPKP